jgi:hypothetical protein
VDWLLENFFDYELDFYNTDAEEYLKLLIASLIKVAVSLALQNKCLLSGA